MQEQGSSMVAMHASDVMDCEQDAVFPQPSVADQVLVIVPLDISIPLSMFETVGNGSHPVVDGSPISAGNIDP